VNFATVTLCVTSLLLFLFRYRLSPETFGHTILAVSAIGTTQRRIDGKMILYGELGKGEIVLVPD